MRIAVSLLIISIFAILIAGCDPGIEYNPADWNRIRKYEFTNKYSGFDLELRGFNDLIASSNYILEGEILNTQNNARKLYIEKAILRANGREYVGEPNYRNEITVHDMKLNERQHFSIYWDFRKPLYEVLKDPVELSLVVKSENQSVSISIPMVENKQ